MKNNNEKNTVHKRHKTVVTVCEGAILIALSVVLSYLEFDIGAQGGSISFTMIPLVVFALRRGPLYGLSAAGAFGLLKFMLGGEAIAWESIVFDYLLAYTAVGIAFVGKLVPLKSEAVKSIIGTLAACLTRYFVHFISGVTIYAKYMPESFLGMNMQNAAVYSLLYNGVYMLPSTVVTLIIVPVLYTATLKYLKD